MKRKINHAEREIQSLDEVIEEAFFYEDEIRACHAIAIQIEDVKRRLGNLLVKQARSILRQQRDELYKRFREYDYDVRYAVYGAVPLAVREAIPYSTCWLERFDPFESF